MRTNESYIQLRNQVLELNETASKHCLCKGIDGGCCKPNIKMLPEDQEVIVEAVERGDIDPPTIQRAVRRANDDDLAFCPFLGEQNECTIYEYRPVLCIQHGHGGLPKEKATALKAMRSPGKKTIKISEIEQFSCTACAEHVKPTDRIPLSVVGQSVAILVTIQQGEQHYGKPRIRKFVLDQFGDESK